MTYYLTSQVHSRRTERPTTQASSHAENWQSEEYRLQRREEAHANEISQREKILKQGLEAHAAARRNGHEHDDDLAAVSDNSRQSG